MEKMNINSIKNGNELFKTFFNKAKNEVPSIPTGFKKLDYEIGGGLSEGLYIIGAAPGVGKTTFVQQIADDISSNGSPVLFVNLEMSTKELVAKTIVREAYSIDNNFNAGTMELIGGRISKRDFDILEKAESKANKFENLYYYECNHNDQINEISEKARALKNVLGIAPVIIIDYLQAIAPTDIEIPYLQNVDRNIMKLKELSRELETSVIAISSINRRTYSKPINVASFNKGDNSEFIADVVIGLQLKQMNKDEREIELVILKNSNKPSPIIIRYKYQPKFNLFIETSKKYNK